MSMHCRDGGVPRRQRSRQGSRSLAICLLAVPMPVQAADMRDCRLDSLTFVDPWRGLPFEVTQVGEEKYYFCEGATGALKLSATNQGICRGPYGRIVLEGRVVDPVQEADQIFFAQYSMMDAAPCCGWEVFTEEDWTGHAKGVDWFSAGSAPLLRTQPFASIDGTNEGDGFLNGMVALICRHDLP